MFVLILLGCLALICTAIVVIASAGRGYGLSYGASVTLTLAGYLGVTSAAIVFAVTYGV